MHEHAERSNVLDNHTIDRINPIGTYAGLTVLIDLQQATPIVNFLFIAGIRIGPVFRDWWASRPPLTRAHRKSGSFDQADRPRVTSDR
jgi:hypothetical protein